LGPRPGLTEATLSYTNATPYLAYGGANQDGTITLTVYAYSTPDRSVSPGEWDAEGAVLVGTTTVQASSSPTNEDLVFDLVKGTVNRIAADLIQDQKAGVSFYTARIGVEANEMTRLQGLTLMPGMPVEAFIETGERTALSYLMKPLSDQLSRAWRED
jgi:multidrug efflux pump subunit AcrA (membrane-fusion protein)